MKSLFLAILAPLTLWTGAAIASPCLGKPPAAGATIHGPVLHVIDGETLCVALGPDPARWVQLRLLDPPSGSTRSLLMATAFSETVDCTVVEASRAVCTIAGRDMAETARTSDARERAKFWR